MSETPNQPVTRPKGLISTLLASLGKICAALIGSLFFSLVVEWLGIAFLWSELGAEHSRMMMETELNWFAENVTRSLLISDPVNQLTIILGKTWRWLFMDTGFIPWLEKLRDKQDSDWFHWLDIYVKATVYITLTFVLRVFILLLTSPLFILAALTGIVDGLVRRDIRRFGCGYESGFIYHHAKRTVIPMFFLAWMIYLSLPFSINPCVILLPAAFLLGVTISITVGAFKKYM
ncbi:TIGR03747 family integrating conjugative element membrane protein [Brenneria tiliae]|uniref:TIGR03747 family integrating conjugative element membrane protein n=1 Tax=Brenneria tiliae TaxID=2914984 RepID=A0ABT0MNF5_9GAMM|nr:TIGR03747 family integrating conjugative element membrane protein [Brenneria tiliae]MCL2891380.1 TIGR03747 family integrating conjugative element membrane protein [Brenneria tiliae]